MSTRPPPSRHDLSRAAIEAAREARALAADLIEADTDSLGADLSRAIAHLYGAEVAEGRALYDQLTRAMEALRILRERGGVRMRTALGRALALLHPPRKALEIALGLATRDEPTAPFLLEGRRLKPENERRNQTRVRVETYVGLEGDSQFYTGKTGDLSCGGLFVATDEPLPVGTELVLSFMLPDGYRIRVEGTVTWARAPRYRPGELPSGMGVRFESLTSRDRNAIEHFLRENPPIVIGD